METKFNKKVQKHRRRLIREGWQEKLPVRPFLYLVIGVLLLTLAVLVNQPGNATLNSAEIDVLRSKGVLRIGVDEELYGLHVNGRGLEASLSEKLCATVFESDDRCELIPVTRQTAQWKMEDGMIDLAVMSLASFSGKTYLATEMPFYTDQCVLLGYKELPSLHEAQIAVLKNTAAYSLLCTYQEDVENGLVIRPYAAYYDMLVALRAGTVDAVCLPRTVAMTYREKDMILLSQSIGAIEYHVIGKQEDKALLELMDSLLVQWAKDGTLRGWYEEFDLLYG